VDIYHRCTNCCPCRCYTPEYRTTSDFHTTDTPCAPMDKWAGLLWAELENVTGKVCAMHENSCMLNPPAQCRFGFVLHRSDADTPVVASTLPIARTGEVHFRVITHYTCKYGKVKALLNQVASHHAYTLTQTTLDQY
jgi:hypothetical protein